MPHPGELDQVVTVSRLTSTDDGIGGRVSTWGVINTLWARVIAGSGKETLNSDRIEANANYKFTFRNGADIKEADKLTLDSVDYNVRAILPNTSRDLYLHIDAERGVAQ